MQVELITGRMSQQAMLARVVSAPLLKECGGPYLSELPIQAIGSWTCAVDIIEDMVLDGVARRPLDVLMADARRCAEKCLRSRMGTMRWLCSKIVIRPATSIIANDTLADIRKSVDAAIMPVIADQAERRIVGMHLDELLSTAVIACEDAIDEEYKMFWAAIGAALHGYLPVDIIRAEECDYVLVY